MPESNGTARLDRMEKILERFIADHQQMRQAREFFQQEHSQLLKAQVVQSDQIRKNSEQIAELVKVSATHTGQIGSLGRRVDDLVSAIGNLVSRIPPSALA